eukprot:2698703-Rhodomonas_salina.1
MPITTLAWSVRHGWDFSLELMWRMVSVTCFFSSRVSPVRVIRSPRYLKALCGDSLVRLASPNLSPPPAISVPFAKSNP